MRRGNKNVLYPRRQRCLECRRFFGPLVVKGLYCSYPCAQMPLPLPGEAGPMGERACLNNGHGSPKKRWDIEELAQDYARIQRKGGDQVEVYACERCGGWHIGHPPGYRKRKRDEERRKRRNEDREAREGSVRLHHEAVEVVRPDQTPDGGGQ